MIGKITTWLIIRTGLKGPELLFVLALLFILLVGTKLALSYQENIEDRVISDIARQSAEDVVRVQEQQHQVDLNVVERWIEIRDTYREQQKAIVDTSYLEFYVQQHAPQPVDEGVEEENNTEKAVDNVTPTKEHTNVSTFTTPTDNQLDALHRGLWDNYCLAISNEDPDC